MNNGITYYKKVSSYPDDITKNCALTAQEMDNNFFVLEGRDIKSISVVDNKKIVVTLLNGETISSQDAFDNFITSVDFNDTEGILTIKQNDGQITEIEGIATTKDVINSSGLKSIATDETLTGEALYNNPLGISNSYKTGQYMPVDYIEYNDGNTCFCQKEKPAAGTRILSSLKVSPYGLLYDYKAVSHIARMLQDSHSPWHIPSKEEWDDMLNAVEPCEHDRNHDSTKVNHQLGKWAGKILKSSMSWNDCKDLYDESCCDCDCNTVHENASSHNSCHTNQHCHDEYNINKAHKNFAEGIGKYGFNVLPAGYADDGRHINFFGDRACFWTATNIHRSNVCVKRFEHNKTTVHQGIASAEEYLSLRLVRDYDGKMTTDIDQILGQDYPIVSMPSIKNGKSLWTAINFYYDVKHCNCLQPNNGIDLSKITVYFIDEWDGLRWHRNTLREGDSVVVKNAPNNKVNVEYRIINNKLVNVYDEVYNNVIETIQPEIENLSDNVNELMSHKVDWTELNDERKSIVLKNNDMLMGTDESGATYNLAMVSKWNVADFGSDKLHLNFNSADRITVNDNDPDKGGEQIAYLSDIESSNNEINNAIDNLKDDLVEQIKNVDEKLDNEIVNRTAKDEETDKYIKKVEDNLISLNNTDFNEDTGVLTITKYNGNNKGIQLRMNFGTF